MASALRTPLCDLLEVEHPILSAGMGAGARAELASAVSGAGGFGVLGASGVPPDVLRREVARTRGLTDGPFGINIIVADDPRADVGKDRRFVLEQMRAAAEAGASAVVLFWGMPRRSSTRHMCAGCAC